MRFKMLAGGGAEAQPPVMRIVYTIGFRQPFSMYNPQNETEDEDKSKRLKNKTKCNSKQNEAYPEVRFFSLATSV